MPVDVIYCNVLGKRKELSVTPRNTERQTCKLTLRKESKAPLDMLSTMIIIVLPAEGQREQDVPPYE